MIRHFVLLIAIPGLYAQLTTQPSPAQPRASFEAFEVAAVKPTPPDWKGGRYFRMQTANQFVARNYALRILISAAFHLSPKAVFGGPAWIDSDSYDVLARTPGNIRPNTDEQTAMLRKLLTDRFYLAYHRETREMPIYALTVAKSGPKLRESVESFAANPEGPPPLVFVMAPDIVRVPGRYTTTAALTDILQRAAFDRPVIDRTGLKGRYDFDLEFAPDDSLFGGLLRSGDPAKPGLFAAIQEQLGLKLEAAKGPVSALVIDRIERPSEN